MSDKKFLKNTALLFGAMTVTKIVGAVFKIPLANILGGTGMGYFSAAYGLYSPVFALTAAGVPTVIMRLTAQELARSRPENAMKLKNTALLLFSVIGVIGTVFIWLVSGWFSENITGCEESHPAVIAIAPAVLFCCIASVLRGYYEGHSNVIPTAAANVTEAVSRAAVGLVLSYGTILYFKWNFENGRGIYGHVYTSYDEAYSASLPYAAAAAIAAVTISEICGLLALIFHDKRQKKTVVIHDNVPTDRSRDIVLRIIREILPVAASALVMNCFSFADLITVTKNLDNSIQQNPFLYERLFPDVADVGIKTEELANFMYGSYTGIAMSLFMLIPSFAGMTEKTAIPDITSAWENNDMDMLRKKAESLIRITGLIGFPACFGAAALSKPILFLLYRNRMAEISVCADSFVILCLGGMFMILFSTLTGIFQAIGKAYIPLWIMAIAVVIKFVLTPTLVSIPEINITGAALSTILSYIAATFICVIFIKRSINGMKLLRTLAVPCLCGTVCAVSAIGARIILDCCVNELLSTLLAILTGGFVYIISTILTTFFRTKPIIKH